jgi:hypothetical protein
MLMDNKVAELIEEAHDSPGHEGHSHDPRRHQTNKLIHARSP